MGRVGLDKNEFLAALLPRGSSMMCTPRLHSYNTYLLYSIFCGGAQTIFTFECALRLPALILLREFVEFALVDFFTALPTQSHHIMPGASFSLWRQKEAI